MHTMLILTVICGVLSTIVTIAQMFLLSQVVNAVFLLRAQLAQTKVLLFLLLTSIIIRSALVWCRETVSHLGAIRAKTELRQNTFAHILRLGPTFCKGERTGELVATLSEGIERLDPYISRYLPQILLSVFIPSLIALTIMPFDLTSALLLLVTGPIIPLLMMLIGSCAQKHIQQQWLALSRMSAYLLDTIQGLTTLKLFGRSVTEQKRIERVSDNFCKKTMCSLRLAFLSGAVLEFMAALAIGMVAVTLGIRLLNQGISFQIAFFILLLTPEFYRPLRDLGTHRHSGMEGKAALQRLFDINKDIDMLNPLPATEQTTTSGLLSSDTLTINFSDITYTYPGNETAALSHIQCMLAAHTCTALVGRSGSGKSTLVNLLLRFIESNQGVITVNGFPMTALSLTTWRERIAVVHQRPYLFFGTIRENICMARPTATDQEIIEAAKQAGAFEFIQQLPQGFDAEIGAQGMRLSAGQAQRLAIARAFLKDAPLLILDEPTSNLDPISEQLIRQSLRQLMLNRTVLVIAHRYNTIVSADQVVVLDKGSIVEIGSPAELIQKQGAFARLMMKQRGARSQI
ncbi:MAG TPA: thiol reductant ABC exporter subunit CydD [Ktedonobacteraceae bacterium]|jgi:ATP-binding cassette subfamily C protein CydD|nr:thiol reductant ABC exporter subunit CydD [Ktedonobacteraceae bacterium]